MEERRKSKRINKSFVAKFKRIDPDFESKTGNWEMVLLRDLSPEGIGFFFDQAIEPGTVLDMGINLPGRAKDPLNCKGTILRVDCPGDSALNRVAAIFTDISDEDKEYIKNLSEELD